MADGKSTMCADTTSIATPVNNVEMIAASSRKKSISDLPVNLVEEILSRVPLKSMRAVRLTCKQWEALSKSRSFSKMHIGKLSAVKEGESTIVLMMDNNLSLMKVVLVGDEDPFIECQGRLDNKQIRIYEVFHCDGLLLCVLRDDHTKFIVWNPYSGQTRSIESLRTESCPWNWFTYALGYEEEKSSSSCRRRYKLLRFIDHQGYDTPTNQYSCYEIYDFESSTWKRLDITRPHWCINSEQHHGVSLKGNTYWPASPSSTEDEEEEEEEEALLADHMICFDFSSESFGPLLRLPFDAGDDEDYVTLSCVRDEKLAVLLSRNEGDPLEFEIWISTKIEPQKVSWSKFLRVDMEMGFYAMVDTESFFIDEEKKVAMSYSKTLNIFGEDGYLKELELVEGGGRDGKYCRTMVCSYVPSLAQIKQPTAGGGQRKQQSDLEKQ